MAAERVLVTGASGRIGAAVAADLARDHHVIGYDRLPGPFTSHIGDVTDEAGIAAAARDVSAIVHAAALHAPHVGKHSRAQFEDVNVGGTASVLRAARAVGARRVVYTSTTSLYGDAMVGDGTAVWVDEALKPQPRDDYDDTKIAAERLCAEACVDGLTCISLRMSRCFPEPEPLLRIYRLYRGVDARDVAAAHRAAIYSEHAHFDVYNVSAPSPFMRSDLVALYEDAAAVILRYFPWARSAFEERGWSLPQRIDRVYVVDKAVRELGYAPRHDFASLFGRRA